MLLKDLNVDLHSIPVDERGKVTVEGFDAMDVQCMTHQFWPEGTGDIDMAPTDARAVSFIPARLFYQSQVHLGEVQKGWIELDHRAIIAVLHAGKKQVLKAYWRRCQRFPIQLCKYSPRLETETMFEELQAAYEKPPPQEVKANSWISNVSWHLIDHCAMLQKREMPTQ